MKYEQFITEIQENQYSSQPEPLTREEAEMVGEIQLARVARDFDRFELWQDLLCVREKLNKNKAA
jgi:hypothetical protein